VRPRVALEDAQVTKELTDRPRGHRAAPIGVEGELAVANLVAVDGVGDRRDSAAVA
jgi:hypothetical protein